MSFGAQRDRDTVLIVYLRSLVGFLRAEASEAADRFVPGDDFYWRGVEDTASQTANEIESYLNEHGF